MNDSSLITFKAITNFVKELGDMYEKKHKPLKLYNRLISQTRIGHEQCIKKHIEAFKKFCVANREALRKTDVSLLEETNIKYSNKVYIDMSIIFSFADDESRPIIWQHLLYISASTDPAGKAKEILLRNLEEEKKAEEGETNFLADIITKVENSVGNDSTNPMDAIGSIMNSGILTDLLGGLQNGTQNGNLDLSKLMGVVSGMVNQMSDQANDPKSKQMVGMMKGMIGMMTQPGENGQTNAPPDMGSMMAQMMGVVGQMQGQPDSSTIQEVETENKEDSKNKE